MNKQILVAFIIVILVGALAGLYLAWTLSNYNSNSVMVSGTLEQGVEPGCVILRADDGTQYLLLGSLNNPPYGSRVSVMGYVVTGVASYCMQGETVIHVVSISVSEFTGSQSISYGTATAANATIITISALPSATFTGVPITVSGYVYMVAENPQCYPACLAPSFILIYIDVPVTAGCTGAAGCYPPPQNYRLLNTEGSPYWANQRNGTYTTVSGLLVTPSGWNCNSSYVPRICMLGDIYVKT